MQYGPAVAYGNYAYIPTAIGGVGTVSIVNLRSFGGVTNYIPPAGKFAQVGAVSTVFMNTQFLDLIDNSPFTSWTHMSLIGMCSHSNTLD